MQRVIVGVSTISLRTEDVAQLVPAVSVAVAGSADDGVTVGLSAVTINSPMIGVHTVTMTVSTPTLVRLVWTVDGSTFTDLVDVIGRPILTPLELRESDLSLTSTPAGVLIEAIDRATAECEMLTGHAWTPRYDIDQVTADRYGRVLLPPRVRRVGRATGADGTVFQVSGLRVCDHLVEGFPPGWVGSIGFERGLGEAPQEIVWAVGVRARQIAQQSGSAAPLFSTRVVVGPDGEREVRSLPGALTTGNAEVDAVYARHRFGGVGFA